MSLSLSRIKFSSNTILSLGIFVLLKSPTNNQQLLAGKGFKLLKVRSLSEKGFVYNVDS